MTYLYKITKNCEQECFSNGLRTSYLFTFKLTQLFALVICKMITLLVSTFCALIFCGSASASHKDGLPERHVIIIIIIFQIQS